MTRSNALRKLWVRFLRRQSFYLSGQSALWLKRLGRNPYALHPKHLYGLSAPWYENHLKPGLRFLDVGSGVGTACIQAAKRGAEQVTGLEGSKQNLCVAIARAQSEGLPAIEFLHMDLEKASFPFPDESFDVALFSNVIEHLNHRVEVLREIWRVLVKDGVLLVSAPNGETPWKRRQASCGFFYYDDTDHKVEYNRESLRKELVVGGFFTVEPWNTIVLSTPLNGLCDFSAVLSPALFRYLSRWKVETAQRHPERSIGWQVIARKMDICGVGHGSGAFGKGKKR